ncbi:Amidase [Moelleriella libera RCEF 2490]|uniref:Amidase n=1 Tax=Moelleriella libera RCEF 2490 TaxID=1081109 RepID=A0A168CLM4_9HYPO|nr:Amidase [Moelleriella libera RCEF 2490]
MDRGDSVAVKPLWRTVVERKRELQAKAIANSCNNEELLPSTPAEIDQICSADASDIVRTIERGKASATFVVQCFMQSLTEVLFSGALKDARLLDKEFQDSGKCLKPLHGVPVTVKDQFDVEGVDTTLGYVGRSFRPAAENAVLVTILKSLGAVILAKSNLPQSILWCETDNPLWGRTDHPLNRGYTPGGSTGGEAVLLACRGSALGWGTDIGGSIRIPSHMMGLYGLKPSSARLPYRGVPVSTDGQEHVPSSIGPMARSLDDIHLAMKCVINAEPWKMDARCVPLPWRLEMFTDTLGRPLTIGVLVDDGVVEPHPPIRRVMAEAEEALRAAGHDVFPWNNELHRECIQVMDEFYAADGGEDIRSAIDEGGEPVIPHVQRLLDAAEPITVYQYWQLNKRKWKLQQAYLDKWTSLRSEKTGRQADVLLMPPMPHSAVPHGQCRWVGYTKVWNLLDYPALVIPGGRTIRADADVTFSGEPRNQLDGWNRNVWEKHGHEMASLGLPVGLQLICRKFEEEKLLAAGQVLDCLFRKQAMS